MELQKGEVWRENLTDIEMDKLEDLLETT